MGNAAVELDLWRAGCSRVPELANLQQLWFCLDAALVSLETQQQLQVAGDAIIQVAQIVQELAANPRRDERVSAGLWPSCRQIFSTSCPAIDACRFCSVYRISTALPAVCHNAVISSFLMMGVL